MDLQKANLSISDGIHAFQETDKVHLRHTCTDLSDTAMVLIANGSSEHGAHILVKSGTTIC